MDRARSGREQKALKKEGIMKGLKRLLLGATFSIFAATSLAASSLEGRSAPDFVLKSSIQVKTCGSANIAATS